MRHGFWTGVRFPPAPPIMKETTMSVWEDKKKTLEDVRELMPFVDGEWQHIKTHVRHTDGDVIENRFLDARKKVLGGWLYKAAYGAGLAFIPDPHHVWDKWTELPE